MEKRKGERGRLIMKIERQGQGGLIFSLVLFIVPCIALVSGCWRVPLLSIAFVTVWSTATCLGTRQRARLSCCVSAAAAVKFNSVCSL